MSTQSVVERSKAAIEQFLPDLENLKLAEFPGYADKVQRLGTLLNLDSTTPVKEIKQTAMDTAASYFKMLDEAPCRETAEPTAISAHLEQSREVLKKFEALLSLVNGEAPAVVAKSVLDLCGYQKGDNGINKCFVPKDMSLIQVFELANTECERLGITPAVYSYVLEGWKKNPNANAGRSVDEHHEVIGFVDGSLTKNRKAQEGHLGKKELHMATIEGAALENILTHIASHGQEDSFKDKFVRCGASDVALYRDSLGLRVRRPDDAYADADVGAAASPN